ncbi:MAG: tetratricopeptide repeat protein [Candidatus Omnitrophota bacterium]
MVSPAVRKIFPNTAICLLFIFAFLGLAIAAGKNNALPWDEIKATELQKEAQSYRSQGLEAQRIGNIEGAMSFYQKAIEMDPTCAACYNDIGIVYEGRGMSDEAEKFYLKAAKADPSYLSPYTNLALLYEAKRNLEKAAYYWGKRADLGLPEDPWTEKARARLDDISLVQSANPLQDIREREVIGLLKDIAAEKANLGKDKIAQARQYFSRAKAKFKQGDEVTAWKLAVDASQLDPENSEIQEFIDRVQLRMMSR